jgi:hypothetical protein
MITLFRPVSTLERVLCVVLEGQFKPNKKKDDEINYFFYLKNDQNKRYCNLIRDRLATANRKLLLQ